MLPKLDYHALERVMAELADEDLENLVGVFSQRRGAQLLCVYLGARSRPVQGSVRRTVALARLAETDLSEFDGLFVGISALDVVRPDIVTKGPDFYPLEDLFLARGQRARLVRTFAALAAHLLDFSDRLPDDNAYRKQRARAKALALALPALLDERGAAGLVAILPGADLEGFIAGRAGQWLRVSDDLAALGAPAAGDWVIALEELARCGPWPCISPDNDYFINLHNVLRRPSYVVDTAAVSATCRALALRMHSSAPREETPVVTWALLAESWLAEEDVEDLIAYFPHANIDYYAQTGCALRIYRSLVETNLPPPAGDNWSAADLTRQPLPPSFGRIGFALLPLPGHSMEPGSASPPLEPLGPILAHAGHPLQLERTLCALTSDGLGQAPFLDGVPGQALVNLAQRALLVVSLSNPWDWPQGRYNQQLTVVYAALAAGLAGQAAADSSAETYYQALADWCRCGDVSDRDEFENLLRRMTANLRTFLRATSGEDGQCAEERTLATELIAIAQAALYPEVGFDTEVVATRWDSAPRRDERGRMYRLAIFEDYSGATSVFRRAWRQVLALRHERQQIQMLEHNADTLQRKCEELLDRVQRNRRPLFAPPHELAVLHFVFQQEERLIEDRLHELRTEAQLQITAINQHLEYGRPVDLALEVSNTGRIGAHDVDLVLASGTTFEWLDPSPVRELANLRPGMPQRVTYRVRATQANEATFEFSCSYAGLDKPQKLALRLPVRQPEESNFTLIGNPYKFGRYIQEPDDFFGREDVILKIMTALASGGHADFLLRGPRRMGKTSTMYMIENVLLKPELRRRFQLPSEWDAMLDCYHPLRLDLQAFPFQDDLAHITRFFFALLDNVCCALAPAERPTMLANFQRRQKEVDAPIAVLEQLARLFELAPRARVVVLLDEYDEVYRPQGRALDMALRHVVQEEQRLTWVIASTQFLFKEGRSYGSPWFNILDPVELTCLDRRAAMRLVDEPSRRVGVEWQSDAVVALLDETGRHPFFLQVFCGVVMDHLNREKLTYVMPKTVAMLGEQIVAEHEQEMGSRFDFYWSDTSGVGQLALLAVEASDHAPTRLELQRAIQAEVVARFGVRAQARVKDAKGAYRPWLDIAFDDGMTWLSEVVNAVRWDGASRSYSYTVPLVRRWLERKGRYEDLDLHEAALKKVEAELAKDGIV